MVFASRLQGMRDMRRDRRLLLAMFLFTIALIACAAQIQITALYIDAAVLGGWKWFATTFSVELPFSDPGRVCLDYCAPPLPFLAGWIALATFVLGWAMLAYAWWSPRVSVPEQG